tara:strand:+ start:1447 stop:1758 length:312 start_codon:yes stop_codon:yes gene_type:complete
MGDKKLNKEIKKIINVLRAEKRGERSRKQIEDILGGKIPDIQWKTAIKEVKEGAIGYAQNPIATAKGFYEGITGKTKKKENKKGGSVSKYSKGGGVRSAKYKI